MKTPIAIAILASFLSLGTMAAAEQVMAPKDVVVMDMGSEKMLTGSNGLTLYTFDKDTDGKSACNDACAKKWPPLKASAGAKPVGAYTIVKRDDGTLQWAYKGKPLYFFVNDKASMDMNGNGVGGKWHLAKP